MTQEENEAQIIILFSELTISHLPTSPPRMEVLRIHKSYSSYLEYVWHIEGIWNIFFFLKDWGKEEESNETLVGESF